MRTCRAGTRRPVGRPTAGPKNGPGLSEMMMMTDVDSLGWLFLSPEANYPVDVMRDASVRWDEQDALTSTEDADACSPALGPRSISLPYISAVGSTIRCLRL